MNLERSEALISSRKDAIMRRSLIGLSFFAPLLLATAAVRAQESPDRPPAPAQDQSRESAMASSPAQPIAVEEMVAVLGTVVHGTSGTNFGRIVEVLVDGSGEPRAAVLDYGGFLGVGSRKVLVSWKTLRFSPGDKDRAITIELTADQIKAAPDYKGGPSPAQVAVPAAALPPPAPTPSAPASTPSAPDAAAQAASPPPPAGSASNAGAPAASAPSEEGK
jgi:hypothetical protein